MLEEIEHQGQLFAIIIRKDYQNTGVHFFTPHSYSQQLAYLQHPQGKIIAPHIHNLVRREIEYTQEVLVIKKGKVRVDFYTEDRCYFLSKILHEGDVILLAKGGHGFEILEETEMYEIKQGPFMTELDKVRFTGVSREEVVLQEVTYDAVDPC